MSKVEVNEIDKQNGSTLTIGGSGTTVQLGTGASQTGFGRTGAVDWQTSIKTGDFTAVSGEGYFINTTSGQITMTLPASPSAGDIVAFKDYAGTFQTSNLIVGRNGSNIVGGTVDATISVEGQSVILVYGDATQGWQPVEAATNADLPRPSFISATGGTVSTVNCGACKVHTFTGPGTFCVSAISGTPANNQVSYLVVAGGGGGGQGGGGGGAGGFREVKAPTTPYTASPLDGYSTPGNIITVTATAFPVQVGGGGPGSGSPIGPAIAPGTTGTNSNFSTIISAGGGGAGSHGSVAGATGGSGGGNGNGSAASGQSAKAGNTPSTTPPQGQPGGASANPNGPPAFGGSGGGGAGAAGGASSSSAGGAGGAGVATSINGSSVTRAGGGGGSVYAGCNQGAGGSGGGGAGGPGNTPGVGTAGACNTGGGGGGGGYFSNGAGANGGSGIVIIRYKIA